MVEMSDNSKKFKDGKLSGRNGTIKAECKADYPHALKALWKALDRAEDLIQN